MPPIFEWWLFTKMLKIPIEEIIQRIKEKTALSEEVINSRISEKLGQLSGLISKEGAAHIVANELGVKLLEAYTGRLQINNILPGIRNLETVGKVISKRDLYEFKNDTRSGKLASFVFGDETGNIRVVMWGSMADKINEIKVNDNVKIIGGYVKENNSQREVHLNEKSKVIINPPGEININIISNTRKKISEMQENTHGVEILGYVVQAFNPSFFEICPQCNKRIKQGEAGFRCEAHGIVTPDYSYVMNLVVDDGSESIKTVFFRQQMEKLLKSTKEDIIRFMKEPEAFNMIKGNLLGTQLKLLGSINKNQFFDRLEFVVSDVSDANADEELKRLNQHG